MILVIDNYDSFTFNVVQYLGELGAQVEVRRNDQITIDEIPQMAPEGIVIGPGAGIPDNAGVSLDVVRQLGATIPTLGVCLGHHAIAQAYGGTLSPAVDLMHGKTSPVYHAGTGLFAGLPNPFQAARYHSLQVRQEDLPAELEVTAKTEDGTIMAVQHCRHPVVGVQFHPESILTENGLRILQNFLEMSMPFSVPVT